MQPHQKLGPASLSGIVCLPGKVLRDGSKLSQKFKLAQRGGPQLVQPLVRHSLLPAV